MRKNKPRLRRKMTHMTDLSDFRGIHAQEKCFIVAAGPSLIHLKLDPIFQHVVISINSSALLMPWTEEEVEDYRRFWISTDPLCIHWDYFWSHVARRECTRIVRTSWRQHYEKIKYYDFRFFEPRKTYVTLDPDDGGLCSYSSVLAAIDFAILMRCKKIYLLGTDHRMLHNKSHFWEFQPKELWPRRSDKDRYFTPPKRQQFEIFERNIGMFRLLQKYAHDLDLEIYNCSAISTVDVFPKMSLEEALKQV